MTHYITPTLLNSFSYYLKSGDEYEEKAKEDFLNCLNKIRTPPTEAMQKGIDFENKVFELTKQPAIESEDVAQQMANILRGGLWQQAVKKTIEIQDIQILLYGKADVIKGNTITDIKNTSKYEIGKYLDSMQHPIYMYCTGLTNFQYLINCSNHLYSEEYNYTKYTENQIKNKVNDFINWLRVNDLLSIYLQKWINKY